jgi:hypothetical protein
MVNILGLPMQSNAPNNISSATPTAQPSAPKDILQFAQPANVTRAPVANAITMAQQLMRQPTPLATVQQRGMVNDAMNENSNQYLNTFV